LKKGRDSVHRDPFSLAVSREFKNSIDPPVWADNESSMKVRSLGRVQLKGILKAACILGLVSIGPPLQAQSNSSISFAATPIPFAYTDWSAQLVFPQFDPSLGTLTSVTLTLSSQLTTDLSIYNSNDAYYSPSCYLQGQVDISVEDPDSYFPTLDPSLLTSEIYFDSLSPFSGEESYGITASGTSYDESSSNAVLLEFSGDGSIALSASTSSNVILYSSDSDIIPSQSAQANLAGTVTYSYTAVPEPSTWAIMAAGVLSLSLFLRRR
jgi:PEP-CTERM motif